MAYIAVTGGSTYRLQSSISSTQTTITLSSFKEPVSGTPYTMSYLNSSIEYATLDPQTQNSEFISFTGITQNADGTATLTGVTRGLSRSSPYTESTTFKTTHAGQSILILSNPPQLYNSLSFKGNDEVITGDWSVPTPVNPGSIANRAWVLSVINGGAVSQNSVVVSGSAGETITAAGKIIYLNTADGRWYNASSASAAMSEYVKLGISQGAGATGFAITGGVLLSGVDSNQSGLVTGTIYYISTSGNISSSAGTFSKAIGVASGPTTIYFDPVFFYTPSAKQKAALAGNAGTPSATNLFLTQDYLANTVYDSTTDQTQAVQNGSVTVGESNATTAKHFLVAQKFIPTKGGIKGVTLWKAADSGSFTGSVKVSLQADTAGSPSGSDLASVTIANAAWLKLAAAAEFMAAFGTEYDTLTLNGTYWIVVTPSTSDNTNHPNLGINTAGGYASGLLRFFNNVDGWTTIPTSMLYFKTLEGVVSKIVETDATGVVPRAVRPYSLIAFDTTTVVVSSTTTETLVYSKAIDGGLLSINGGLRIVLFGTGSSATGAPQLLTVRIKFNGVVITSFQNSTSSASAAVSTRDFMLAMDLLNNSSLSSQVLWAILTQYATATLNGTASVTAGYTSNAFLSLTNSVDFSNPGLLEVTFQWDSSGTVTGTYKGIRIEKITA